MNSLYAAQRLGGFGFAQPAGRAARAAAATPLKRPSQARSRFTVQAIYDAFVRIWRRDGFGRLTTRAVALETGISVGTLYEYFPNKQALLSGYVRHAIEALLAAIDREVTRAPQLPARERLERLVALVCGARSQDLPPFDADMLSLEHQIAEPRHHRRAYEELLAAWRGALSACGIAASPERAEALFIAAWGGRRYRLLLQPAPLPEDAWVAELQRTCVLALL